MFRAETGGIFREGVLSPFLLRLGFAGQLRRLESGGFCRRFFAGQKFSAERRRKNGGNGMGGRIGPGCEGE